MYANLIEGTIRRCNGRRYWPARTALFAFSTEKGFTFLNSACPLLQDNMHLALVQPFYRARISRECTRISLKALYGTAWHGDIGRPVQLCARFAPRKGLHFLTLHALNFLIISILHYCNLCTELGLVANVREFN